VFAAQSLPLIRIHRQLTTLPATPFTAQLFPGGTDKVNQVLLDFRIC
jgi:hypothetical protein